MSRLNTTASTAATEVLYLQNLLKNLGFAHPAPTPVYEDNTACIKWGNRRAGARQAKSTSLLLAKRIIPAMAGGHLENLGQEEWRLSLKGRLSST